MAKYSTNQYVDIFYKLPKEIQDVISESSTTDHITIIGKKHNLHIDKIGDLVDITFDVMMGITATKDFVKELSDTLEISVLDASIIARDIDENVLKPIKETMLSLYSNGAPYKPSSSLVQFYDEEDTHPSLNRDTLLKEIESPAAPIVKKEIVSTSVISPKPKNPETTKESKQITEYHQEIQQVGKIVSLSGGEEYKQPVSKLVSLEGGKVNSNSDQLTNSPTNKLDSMDFLNKITSIKLSNTFVMPKDGGIETVDNLVKEDIQKERAVEAVKIINELDNKTTLPPVLDKKPDTTPVFEAITQAPKIDPYREQI